MGALFLEFKSIYCPCSPVSGEEGPLLSQPTQFIYLFIAQSWSCGLRVPLKKLTMKSDNVSCEGGSFLEYLEVLGGLKYIFLKSGSQQPRSHE